MSCRVSRDAVHYRSVRAHKGALPARFVASYRPVGEQFGSSTGTLESFLTERYCLYSAGVNGERHVWRGDIHHELWPLQRAEAEVEELEMTSQIGVTLPETEPLLHYARRLDVVAWAPKRITT
jgi:hypothetical protein